MRWCWGTAVTPSSGMPRSRRAGAGGWGGGGGARREAGGHRDVDAVVLVDGGRAEQRNAEEQAVEAGRLGQQGQADSQGHGEEPLVREAGARRSPPHGGEKGEEGGQQGRGHRAGA